MNDSGGAGYAGHTGQTGREIHREFPYHLN